MLLSGKEISKIYQNLDNIALPYTRHVKLNELDTDIDLLPIIRHLKSKDFSYPAPNIYTEVKTPFNYSGEDVKVIAFSGGKVSLACALRYKDAGQKIVLLHIEQNKELTSRCQKMADMMDVPLYVHTLPDTWNIENNPTDSATILRVALQYILGHEYSIKLVYGYFDDASIYNNRFEDWGKCKEFMVCYKEYIQKFLPDFNLLNPMPNYSIVWDELLNHKPYIKYISTDNAIDAITLKNAKIDFSLDERVSSIYMQNINELKKDYKRRYKKTPGNIVDLWNEYFYYRIEQSKFYKELMELPI